MIDLAAKNSTQLKKLPMTPAARLRNSAAGIKLGNQLFTQGNSGLSPIQVTGLLRAALKIVGYDLPPDAIIGLDGAQMIMAGGAFVNSLSTATDIKAAVVPGVDTIKAVATLMKDLGAIDQKTQKTINLTMDVGKTLTSTGVAQILNGISVAGDLGLLNRDEMQILTLGKDITSVVASGFLNVAADLQLVLDCVGIFGGFGDQVKADAYRDFGNYMRALLDPQKLAATNIINQYNQGKINIFETMGEVATTSPNLFLGYFPDMGGFIPSYTTHLYFHHEETSWWGDHNSYDIQQDITAIYNGKDVVEMGIIEKFVLDPLEIFYEEGITGGLEKISMQALTCLVLASNMTSNHLNTVDPGWSAIKYLQQFRVTPYILGDEKFFGREIPYSNQFVKIPAKPSSAGLVLDGEPVFTASQKLDSQKINDITDLQNHMKKLDQDGDIDGLLNIPLAKAMLLNYCKPDFSTFGVNYFKNSPENIKSGHMLCRTPSGSVNLQDYWQGLGILSQIKATNYFKTGPVDLNQFNYLGELEEVQARYNYFHNFWLAKNLNILALSNISRYLGTTPSKLQFRGYTPQGLGVFKKG